MTIGAALINLDRSPDRLAFMGEQLARLGIPFERLSAVDGAALTEAVFKKFSQSWQRPLSRGEVGCLLSHAAAWRMSVAGERKLLVLEDDIRISERLPRFLANIEESFAFDFINLQTFDKAKTLALQPIRTCEATGVQLYDLHVDRGGSGAYLVSPSGAEQLLARLEIEPAPSDASLNRLYRGRRCQADPGLATSWNADGFHTTLASPARNFRSRLHLILTQPHFKIRRLRAYIKVSLRKVRLRGTARARVVPLCPSIAPSTAPGRRSVAGS